MECGALVVCGRLCACGASRPTESRWDCLCDVGGKECCCCDYEEEGDSSRVV